MYLVGCETVIAVGTSLFAILISGTYACFSHAAKGNVDIFLAIIILVGSSAGSRIGASATKYVKEENLRLLFGFCVGLVSLSVSFKLIDWISAVELFGSFSQTLLVLAAVAIATLIVLLAFRNRTKAPSARI